MKSCWCNYQLNRMTNVLLRRFGYWKRWQSVACLTLVFFSLSSFSLGRSPLAISVLVRRLSKISSGMVTLFSLEALRSISFASAPRPFVINQRADSGTNLKCYYNFTFYIQYIYSCIWFVLTMVLVAQT